MIVLLGPPGCGKGTVATILKTKHHYLHLSTGELIRSMLDQKKELQEIINQGKLIDDSMMNELVKEYLSTLSDCQKKKLILDGYPRTEKQALFLETLGVCDNVILIDIPENVCIKRIVNRNEGRADDNSETAKLRWDQYLQSTKPLIKFYTKKRLLREINGQNTKEEVLNEVLGFLNK